MTTPAAVRARSLRPFDAFLGTRYFPALDGLRAVSILLVIALHTQDGLWMRLHGTVGVTVFFVISGWLITTLLLREERATGRARLGAFYVRRAFRLLPVYFAVLGVFVLLIAVIGLQWGHDAFVGSLPYYLTYQNDFAPTSLFGHTWSLAIEEKFYLVWPLAAFAVVRARRLRVPILLAGIVFCLVAEHSSDLSIYYFATYTPLLLGCLLAVVMNDPRTYRWLRPLAHPAVTLVLVALAAAQTLLFEGDHGHVHTLLAVLVTLAFPGILVGSRRVTAVLSWRPLVHIGTRSYSLYLIHPLIITVVGYVLPAHSSSRTHEVVHLAVILAVSLAAAEMLHRLVERPMIAVGRRILARPVAPRPAASQVRLNGPTSPVTSGALRTAP